MPIEFKHHTLDNGLTIIAECDEEAHSAAAGYFVKTGARDEATPLMGVSHFLEHMMFKGTSRRTAEEVNRDFDRIGARNNAYTSAEMTCFYASVLPEKLDAANDIIADMLRPALREEDFTTEKGVILEEIAMYRDNPFWVLYERSMEEHYGKHPLSHRVLGTDETITAMTAAQMRDYFQKRYSADNTVVAAAGKIDFDVFAGQVAALCGEWEKTGAARAPDQPTFQEKQFEMRDPKITRAYALLLAPAPGIGDDRRYAASLLSNVLGGSENARLHWALIETGLAEEAESAFDARDGTGDYFVYVSCDPQRLDEIWKIVEREIDNLSASLTEDDLEKIRARAATGVTLSGERPGGRMQRLGRQWTYLGTYTTLEEELERINAVTVADIRALLEEFPLRPRTVGRLLPAE
jgi:predicted Zn-dependent peptidase